MVARFRFAKGSAELLLTRDARAWSMERVGAEQQRRPEKNEPQKPDSQVMHRSRQLSV